MSGVATTCRVVSKEEMSSAVPTRYLIFCWLQIVCLFFLLLLLHARCWCWSANLFRSVKYHFQNRVSTVYLYVFLIIQYTKHFSTTPFLNGFYRIRVREYLTDPLLLRTCSFSYSLTLQCVHSINLWSSTPLAVSLIFHYEKNKK